MQELEYSSAEAQRFYDAGNAVVAEMICRGVLDKAPADDAAKSLLARIAEEFGEPGLAEEVRTGRRSDRHAARADGEKFLLIKAWGNGFFSDVDHVLGNLLLAEMTGRTPVIHWGRNSLFNPDRDRDAWGLFFEPVSRNGLDDLAGKGHDFWPPKWNEGNLREEKRNKIAGAWSRLSGLQMLHRPERVVVVDYFNGVPHLLKWLRPGHPLYRADATTAYRALINKYLVVRADIREEIDAFAGWWMPPDHRRPIIAVHVRASDKHKEDPHLDQKNAVYPQVIAQIASRHQSVRVFLMTDSEAVRREFAARYGPALITTEAVRAPGETGVHYMPEHTDRRRLGVEVLKDAYLAARSDFFIGLGSSNVTCFVFHARAWTPQNCLMIGPLMTLTCNPYLYMNHSQLDAYLPPETMERLRSVEREGG